MAKTIDNLLTGKSPYAKGSIRIGDLSGDQPYMTFTNTGGSKTIKLPMPTNINSNVGIQWEQSEMGLLGQAEYMGGKSLEAISDMGRMEVDAAITTMGKAATGMLKESVMAAVLSSNSTLRDFTQNRMKKMLHPNAEMTFRGVGHRTFDFNFDLIPKNERKQKEISLAVREFQEFSLPKVMYSYYKFFTYPNVWKVKFKPNEDFLPSILDCYVTNINIDYSGGGRVSWHQNTAPTHIMLKVSIVESQIFTSEHADGGYYG